MTLSPEIRDYIRRLSINLLNSIARGEVKLADDSEGMQRLQMEILEGEEIDEAEYFHPYGFGSVPLEGAEAVVLFPGGDRSHPLVVAVQDRRHRPTGKEGGEVYLYSQAGQLVLLKADGSVEVSAAPGQKVFVNDGSGGAAVATLADLEAHKEWADQHVHQDSTSAATSAPVALPLPTNPSGTPPFLTGTPAPSPAPAGTEVLRAK